MGAAGGVAAIRAGLAVAACVWATAAGAQALGAPSQGFDWRPQASSLGLSPARAEIAIGCGSSLLPCRNSFEAAQATTLQDQLRWSMEVGVLNLGSTGMALSPGRQGLNVSLVGRQPLSLFGARFSLYGKLGTTYGLTDPSLAATPLAGTDGGHGLSFGAGVSMAFTPRLSASFGFDSHELRLGGGPRDPVRATSLGLQYRY
jgi:OmpA-OmpF porin, OOP family